MNTEREHNIMIGEPTVGMWMFEMPGNIGNFLAHLIRLPDGGFELTYRLRWYRDEKLGRDSQDVRNWYSGRIGSTNETEVIEKTRDIWKMIAETIGAAYSWELLRGSLSVEEFHDKMLQQKGIHISAEQLQ